MIKGHYKAKMLKTPDFAATEPISLHEFFPSSFFHGLLSAKPACGTMKGI
jgi:hypothetical protein